jgi:hypothetical protein
VRVGRLALALVLLSLVVAAPSLSARYPRVLAAAITKAYAPRKVHTTQFCYKHIDNRLYVLASVTYLSNDKPSSVAFQWIETNGWFAMWKAGKVLPGVPKQERAHVRALVKNLRAQCD